MARRPPLFAPIIPTLRLRPILSIHGAVTLNTLSLQLQFYEQSWHSDDRLQACLPAACLARLIRMPAPAPARTRSTRYSSLRRPTMKHLLCQDPAPSNALAPPLLSAALEPDPVRQSWRCKSPDLQALSLQSATSKRHYAWLHSDHCDFNWAHSPETLHPCFALFSPPNPL